MRKSISKRAVAVALSAVLALSGAVGIVCLAAVAPMDTGIVKTADAKVKAKKKTFWRNWTGTWDFEINGKKATKKQIKKIKLKSSNKKVVKIKKKGKKVYLTALKKGKTTLTAKYKGKLVSKYKVTVKEAVKLQGTWGKLIDAKLGDLDAETTKSAIQLGYLAGKIVLNANGTGTLTLISGEKTQTGNVSWLASSATKAQVGDAKATLVGANLKLTTEEGDWLLFSR